jgi:hypothetical protein
VADEAAASTDASPTTDDDTDPFALNTYDVLVGIYSDATEAQQVASELDDVAYDATVASTQGAGDSLSMVFIKGFWTKADADEAIQDLKSQGISTQARVVSVPFDPSAPASASNPNPTANPTASPAANPGINPPATPGINPPASPTDAGADDAVNPPASSDADPDDAQVPANPEDQAP